MIAVMWWIPSSSIAGAITLTALLALRSSPGEDGSLIPRFGRARRDPSLAVLEGFHALKHALRFGAVVHEVACRDRAQLARLADALAPDVRRG